MGDKIQLHEKADDDELFPWNDGSIKDVKSYFQTGPLSVILTIVYLRYATVRI